jgi:hypothetical protein
MTISVQREPSKRCDIGCPNVPTYSDGWDSILLAHAIWLPEMAPHSCWPK